MDKFRAFLVTYFNGEEFEIRYFNSTSYLEDVLRCFLMNKLGIKETDETYKALLFRQEKKKPVSNDATKKFVYKNTVKLMKTNFRTEKRISKSKESEKAFWNHYFGDYCSENNVAIEEMYDPLNASFVSNPKHKNITIDYLYHLKKNERFMNEFKFQMERLVDIKTYAEKKINTLVEFLETNGYDKTEKKFKKEKRNIIKTKKEIQTYIAKFKKLLAKSR